MATEEQTNALQAQATVSSSISIVSSATVTYYLLQEKGWFGGDNGHFDADPHRVRTMNLVLILSVIDMLASSHWLMGELGDTSDAFCDYQGFMIQWWALAGIVWNGCMANSLYNWLVLKKTPEQLARHVYYHVALTVGGCGIVAVVLLGLDHYAFANLWCWISADYNAERFYCFYFILFLTWAYNGFVFISVANAAKDATGNREAQKKLQTKLKLFIGAFVLSWFFGGVNRTLQFFDSSHFIILYLHVFFVPLQGFFNALIYGGLFEEDSPLRLQIKFFFYKYCHPPSDKRNERLSQTEGALLTSRRGSFQSETVFDKEASIYTVTFNLGEANLDEVRPLGAWLPRGHDVYIVCLQECMCLQELREAIQEHLGGPEKFSAFHNEIGSTNKRLGFHGYIALMVFARTEDVESGAFAPLQSLRDNVKQGANLGVYTASNKGSVAFPFGYHDSTFAVMGCHLASDNKGKSRFSQRNKNTYRMLGKSVLTDVDTGLDANLLFHHTICLGDMNFRNPNPNLNP
mmetsp:Transcript_43548/g.136603  ORF Transcript_43548/g.136603 Transcript_43548/m.136603 type:complete len:518 (-) Transcript_43548:28-1581(-)